MVYLCLWWHSEIALEFRKRNREVVTVLLKAMSKSLGLEGSYIDKATNIELGLQILAANYYPACPEPDRAIGIPSHTDHGLLTLLVDNGISGLQIKYKGKWINVNLLPNALFVIIGDHLEVHSVLHLELHFYLSPCIIHLRIIFRNFVFYVKLCQLKLTRKVGLIQFYA